VTRTAGTLPELLAVGKPSLHPHLLAPSYAPGRIYGGEPLGPIPNLGTLGLWVLELFAMYANGQTDGQKQRLLPRSIERKIAGIERIFDRDGRGATEKTALENDGPSRERILCFKLHIQYDEFLLFHCVLHFFALLPIAL